MLIPEYTMGHSLSTIAVLEGLDATIPLQSLSVGFFHSLTLLLQQTKFILQRTIELSARGYRANHAR